MTGNNNISIGAIGVGVGAGAGNTINIHQHQTPDTGHIEYTVSTGSVEHLSRTDVTEGTLGFVGSLLLPILPFVADSIGILSFLGITTYWVVVVATSFAIVGLLLTNDRRKIFSKSFAPNAASFIDGRWVEQEANGNYILYRKTAPCIYPKCTGTVFIRPAPPREHPNHTLVGVCDVGELRHTYTMDFNNMGFPAQFDWRPVEAQKP